MVSLPHKLGFKAQESNFSLKYLSGGKVSMIKYIVLRENMFSQSKTLQHIIEHESKYLNEVNFLKI